MLASFGDGKDPAVEATTDGYPATPRPTPWLGLLSLRGHWAVVASEAFHPGLPLPLLGLQGHPM